MNARGFTLLEVLVALAILGVAVVAAIQGFAQGLRLLKHAGDHQTAMLVADQKLRDVVMPTEGEEEGTDTQFRWKRTISRVRNEVTGTAPPAAWAIYQIEVRVQWDERREVHLATLRMIPNLAALLAAQAPPSPTTPQPAVTPQPQTAPSRATPPPPAPATK